MVPTAERELNQELTWEVNFQLGIEDPVVEDLEQMPGGKNSRSKQWYPFENEVDCAAAMKLIARADGLAEKPYALWSKMLDTLYTVLPRDGGEDRSPSQPVPDAMGKAASSYLSTPPSSSQPFASQMSQGPRSSEHSLSVPIDPSPSTSGSSDCASSVFDRPCLELSARPTQRSLPSFYSLFDAIERTLCVGAQYLEAYAEHLRDDLVGSQRHPR